MAILQASDIADLAAMTKPDFGADRFTQYGTTLQDHVAFNKLSTQKRISLRSGESIDWNVQYKHSGAARRTGLFQVDVTNFVDTMTTGTAPWRHLETSWTIDRRMIAMNLDPARIVDLLMEQREASIVSFGELFEEDFWDKPSTSSNTDQMFGVFYWLTYSATEGFNGGNPTGFTGGKGGISQGTYTRVANWTAQYTDITKIDLIRKVRKAATYTKFKAPKMTKDPSYATGDSKGYYAPYSVLGVIEELAEAQNDNLGNDVASKDGQVLFRRREIEWVPQLDNVLGAPFVGIDWSVMHFYVLQGFFMDETINPAPKQHNVTEFFVDLSGNLVCKDLRKQFLVATAAPID